MIICRYTLFLFLLFYFGSSAYGQTLTGVFDMDRGKIISNNTLVLSCTICNGFSNNSVVFYEQNGNEWVATDSIRISDYVEGLDIADIAVSHTGNAVSISLEKSSNNNFEDDAILVLRKVNNDWIIGLKLDSVLFQTSGRTATYKVDFSKDGETLILVYSNSSLEHIPVSIGITTKIFTFDAHESKYELSQEFFESQYSDTHLTSNLLKNDKLIFISINRVINAPSQKFIIYNYENGLWQRDFSFEETNEEGSYASMICSDEEVKRIAVTKSRFPDGVQPLVTFYQKNEFTNTWESFLKPYYSYINFDVVNFSMSDKGDLFAVGFAENERFSELDTNSYVDLLRLSDQEDFELLHRFTFETGDNTNKYGMTGSVELSNDGKVIMIRRADQKYVYNLSDLIQNNSEVDKDLENLVFPNPTTGQVSIKDHAFESIILLNSTGQYLKEFESREFDISDYPNGIYYLLFKYADKNPAGVKLIKLE